MKRYLNLQFFRQMMSKHIHTNGMQRSLILLLMGYLMFVPTVSASGLLISEIGSNTEDITIPAWVELVNTSENEIDLSEFKLRSSAIDGAGNKVGATTFDLSEVKIKSNSYILIRGSTSRVKNHKHYEMQKDTYYIENDGKIPHWGRSGFVELFKDDQTIDFVKFGSSSVSPTTKGAWEGNACYSLRYDKGGVGTSMARKTLIDTNSKNDWAYRSFATPYGLNDIECNVDRDRDGIPDCAEQSGRTFAGLPLYEWGARVDKRDVFIEVDYMEFSEHLKPNPGMRPRAEALAAVRDVFAKRKIYLHFDTGDLHSSKLGRGNPIHFDLGGENTESKVRFTEQVFVNKKDKDITNISEYKAMYMDPRRKQIFHYMLFGYSQDKCQVVDGYINYLEPGGKTGDAEIGGEDSLITLGCWALSDDATEMSSEPPESGIGMSKLYELINVQSGTIMHELGHNFGLRHGGNKDKPRSHPNYLSVMNYLYQTNGLDDPKKPDAGVRYFIQTKKKCGEKHLMNISGSPFGPPSEFMLDYSDGSGKSLNENSVDEALGLGRNGVPVNFDCQPETQDSYTLQLDHHKLPMEEVHDHNDWREIDLTFGRRKATLYEGLTEFWKVRYESWSLFDVPKIDVINSRYPLANDQQPTADELDVPPRMLKLLRQRLDRH